jgi:hypothetical protein
MKMRPEAEQKLRAGFQRRVDEQAQRYAQQLAHAAQLAARFGCGEVTGVFSMEAGGDPRPRTYVLALLPPLAGIPLLIAAAAAGVRGLMPLFIGFPFAAGAWIGLNFLLGRKPKRRVWLYAFTDGFMVVDNPPVDSAPVRWSQVIGVGQVWTEVFRPGDEDTGTPELAAYRLRLADGRTRDISRSFRNVQDPYREMGQLFRTLAPNVIGKTMPRFPTIDEIIAAFAKR